METCLVGVLGTVDGAQNVIFKVYDDWNTSAARKFEQKVDKFLKNPKDLDQSNFKISKDLHQRPLKSQKNLHQS